MLFPQIILAFLTSYIVNCNDSHPLCQFLAILLLVNIAPCHRSLHKYIALGVPLCFACGIRREGKKLEDKERPIYFQDITIYFTFSCIMMALKLATRQLSEMRRWAKRLLGNFQIQFFNFEFLTIFFKFNFEFLTFLTFVSSIWTQIVQLDIFDLHVIWFLWLSS